MYYQSFMITKKNYEGYLKLPADVHHPFDKVKDCIVVMNMHNWSDWSWMREEDFHKKWTMYDYNGRYLGPSQVIRRPTP